MVSEGWLSVLCVTKTLLGLVFGFNYCLSYTCERTLANAYGYNALSVGLVLLCLGIGEILTIWIVVVTNFLSRECRWEYNWRALV
jgi:hypothetical protein